MKYELTISNRTFDVLRNFHGINQSLLFREGNLLKTVSPQKTILSEIEVDETFPMDFGIYDLKHFLDSILLVSGGTWKRPNLEEVRFYLDSNQSSLWIDGVNGRTKYRFCDPSMIHTPPEKEFSLPDTNAHFTLSAADLTMLMRAAQKIGLPEIIFERLNDGIVRGYAGYSSIVSYRHIPPHLFQLDIDHNPTSDSAFRHIFKVDNLKHFLEDDQEVRISAKGVSLFESPRTKAFIASESHATEIPTHAFGSDAFDEELLRKSIAESLAKRREETPKRIMSVQSQIRRLEVELEELQAFQDESEEKEAA
jgi:hypothetical protein